MRMRVAGDGGVEQVGLPPGPVLHVKGRAGGMVAKADPTDGARFGAVLAPGAFACPAIKTGAVSHRGVACPIDGVPDGRAFGRCRGELGRQGDGLVWREYQVEATQLPRMLRPSLAVVGPPALEQP